MNNDMHPAPARACVDSFGRHKETTMTPYAFLARLGLRPAEEKSLSKSSTVFRQFLAEADTASIAQRNEQLLTLAALESVYPAEQAALDREAGAAARRLEAAEQAFRAAREACYLAQAKASGCSLILEGHRKRIHDQLREAADPRIGKYLEHLDRLIHSQLPGALRFWVDPSAVRSGKSTSRSNVTEVASAKAAAKAAQTEAQALQLQAVGRDDVSKALLDINGRLALALAPAEINCPAMNERGEAGVPEPWRDGPQWRVESVRDYTVTDFIEDNRRAAMH